MTGSGALRPRRFLERRTTSRCGITATIVMGIVVGGAIVRIQAAFPDAHNKPPTGWSGPVFALSQAYPATLPNLEPLSKRKWAQLDFKNPVEAPQYLKTVLDYCLEGNTANNFADVSHNAVRPWYHTPWLDADSTFGGDGREFIHGLTKERTSRDKELGSGQTASHDNWAVGFYNPRGGYTIGRVWKDPAHPDPRNAVFPSHTVTCKLLFTTAPVTEAPYLAGSLEWQGDINRAPGTGPRPTLRLLQVDVAVKDPRAASTTGWVFGTFQYDKAASASANWWEHLVPVGLMWGSDLDHLKLDQQTQQEWINVTRGQMMHLGRKNLVLNGPVDNPDGSCSSCHGFAQVARVNNATPALKKGPPKATVTGSEFETYFTNIKAATALSADYVSVDYSLQLQIGIARAINSGQASLPANLNPAGRGRGLVVPAAVSHLDEVRRDEK